MIQRREMAAMVPVCVVITLLLLSSTAASSQDTLRITLPEAIELAGSRNIDLLRAENALRVAETRIQSARGAFQPTLGITAGPTLAYRLGDQGSSAGGNDNAIGAFVLALSSSYTLSNGSADRAALAQAEQLARATDIAINRTAQTTSLAVIASFYRIAIQRELIAVERENLEAERQQLERIRAFTDAGTRPMSDLYTEEATIAAAEVRLLQAERDYRIAQLDLVQLLRLDPLRNYDFPSPSPAPEVASPADDVAMLVQQAFAARPELAARQMRIEAAQRGMELADATDAPALALTGSVGSAYSTLNDDDGFASQLFTQNPNASVGLSLSLPIFDRNRADAAVALARIEYENEVLALSELRQQVAVEVQRARLDLTTAIAQLAAAERQLAAAAQALDVEQARYETGVTTLTELTQARARYVAAQGNVVQGRNSVELRRQQLLGAVGGIQEVRGVPEPPGRE